MTDTKTRLVSEGPFPIGELAGIVPLASEAEQAALTQDIADNQQQEPIILWKGEVVDGRCRQQALTTIGYNIMYRELNDDLSYDEVSVYVKSVNTRRNLTHTQKVMSACKQSLKPGAAKILTVAKAWGIGDKILKNARYIYKTKPEFVEPLFNGASVNIISADGMEVQSNKVSTIYAAVKREEEKRPKLTDDGYGWSVDAALKSQVAKDWYYQQIKVHSIIDVIHKRHLTELANLKAETSKA